MDRDDVFLELGASLATAGPSSSCAVLSLSFGLCCAFLLNISAIFAFTLSVLTKSHRTDLVVLLVGRIVWCCRVAYRGRVATARPFYCEGPRLGIGDPSKLLGMLSREETVDLP